MREIKFRAWNKETKKMIYLDSFSWPLTALKEEENWKVMQYTGLKDKNNVEIYENDKIEYCGHKLYEVVWDSCAYFKLREINLNLPEWKRDCIDFVETARGELEIIGNIHQEKKP